MESETPESASMAVPRDAFSRIPTNHTNRVGEGIPRRPHGDGGILYLM